METIRYNPRFDTVEFGASYTIRPSDIPYAINALRKAQDEARSNSEERAARAIFERADGLQVELLRFRFDGPEDLAEAAKRPGALDGWAGWNEPAAFILAALSLVPDLPDANDVQEALDLVVRDLFEHVMGREPSVG